MEQRTRRWLIWSSIVITTMFMLACGAFALYWQVIWPFTPAVVMDSSPWIEPQLRALAKLEPLPSGDRIREMDALLHTRGASNRQWQVTRNMQIHGEESNHAVLVLLTSSSHEVQLSTLWFLAFAKRSITLSGDVQQEVISGLSNEDRAFRYFAFMTLVYLDDSVAKPAVKKILQSSSDLRAYALKYCAPRRDFEYTQWITPLLRDPEIRGQAISALTQIGDPSAISEVQRYVSDPFVRDGVQEFLERVQPSPAKKAGERGVAPSR